MADITQFKHENPVLSQIQVAGVLYDIHDKKAHEWLEQLQGSDLSYVGKWTYASLSPLTRITEGLKTTTGIVYDDAVGTKQIALENGDILIVPGEEGKLNREFIYLAYDEPDVDDNVGEFNEFGSVDGLGDLAYKNRVAVTVTTTITEADLGTKNVTGTSVTAHTYKPEGDITLSEESGLYTNPTPSFSGTEGSISVSGTAAEKTVDAHTYTPAGDVSQPTFTGSAMGTHNHTIAVEENEDGNYRPSGTISDQTFSGTAVAGHQHTVVADGTVESGNATHNHTASFSDTAGHTHTITVDDHNHTFTGASHTHTVSYTGDAVNASVSGEVLTLGDASNTVSIGGTTAGGTINTVELAATADSKTVAGSVTVQNANAAHSHTFTGKSVNSGTAGAHTPAGTISKGTFTGAAVEISAQAASAGTPSGTVSKPNFTGTQATIVHNPHSHTVSATGKFTPAGTVTLTGGGLNIEKLKATFAGKQATLSHTVTPGTVAVGKHTHNATSVATVTTE